VRARAVFFDRDDTIIKNVPYLGDPAQVLLLPGAAESLARLHHAGYLLFLVSNQSGVGRGLITVEQVQAVTAEMMRQLGQNYFTRILNCYEEPAATGVIRRKPSPQVVFETAREFALDLTRSYFVGDRLADVLAGRNAGCRTILVLSGHNRAERPLSIQLAQVVAEDLTAVADHILGNEC
jgi:D-glycero-D-manno-heptose 1,7-bisphosphate phosphatase